MNVYLIAGNSCESIKNALEKERNIRVSGYACSISDAMEKLCDIKTGIDEIVLTDQGINCSNVEFEGFLNSLEKLISSKLHNTELKLITRDLQYEQALKSISPNSKNLKVYYIDKVKIPFSQLLEICLEKREENLEDTIPLNRNESPGPAKTGRPFFAIKGNREKDVGSTASQAGNTSPYVEKDCGADAKKLQMTAGNINRVIAVTGHRCAGITSTVANLAVESSLCGLKTVVIDFDIDYRGINLYFSKFGEEADTNPEMAASLIKCLLKPDLYDVNSCRINDKLQVATLAYSLDSRDKLLDFINIKRVLNLVTVLKTKFNVVLIDLPMYFLKEYPGLLIYIDTIGLCINNSLHSIISTVKCVTDVFEKEDMRVFGIKSKAVITRYNENNRHQGRKLTPELTCAVATGISEDFDPDMECAGTVPYYRDFDSQIDSGKKLCSSNKEYRDLYLGILKNLL